MKQAELEWGWQEVIRGLDTLLGSEPSISQGLPHEIRLPFLSPL
jgi:hypothetical protein